MSERPPRFAAPIPVGQLYFPSWERYAQAFAELFGRQYYNNNGPALQALEAELRVFFDAKYVLGVSNATFGLMMAADALELKGKVIVPAFTFIASAQALAWAGLEPVFCDVDPETHQLDLAKAEALIDDGVSAILAVNLWGGSARPTELEALAERRGVKLFFDSAHAFGCDTAGRRMGTFGTVEVFSFHATKILNAAEGGCLVTNDDAVAARLLTMRPSYGEPRTAPIKRVINARMSEAQATLARLSLEDYPKNRDHNEAIWRAYREGLAGLRGFLVLAPAGVTRSNYQYVVCQVDPATFGLTRDELLSRLRGDNVHARRYFYPGLHRTVEFRDKPSGRHLPVTDHLNETCLQLPIGAALDLRIVREICALIRAAAVDRSARAATHADPAPGGG